MCKVLVIAPKKSHPTRGEWIEISLNGDTSFVISSLTPHGVSGLKYASVGGVAVFCGLTPHGVSGLKSVVGLFVLKMKASHPTRGEWIEMRSSLHSICGG